MAINLGRPKLTIELVPSSVWFSNVRSEVTPAEWNVLKRETSRRARYRCEICFGKGSKWPTEAHEVWQYDEDTLTQRLVRLIALCPTCHSVKHLGFAYTRGEAFLAKTLLHLATVNGWDEATTEQYVELAFEIHAIRSRLPWRLDISYLERFGINVPSILENQTVLALSRHSRRERRGDADFMASKPTPIRKERTI